MKQKHLLKIVFFYLLFYGVSYAQLVTTIDFETENSGYTPSATEGTSFTDVFNRYDGSSHSGGAIGGNSTSVWAVEDLSLSNPSIDLSQIDISGSESFTFSIDMLAHHFEDWDSTDELLITYSIDGGSFQNLMWVQHHVGTGDSTNGPAALDLAFDGGGDCGASTTLPALTTGTQHGCTVSSSDFATFTTQSISLSNNSTLDIKLQFNGLTASDEGIYLDNIIITETAASSDPSVTFDASSSSVNETDSDVVTSGISVTLTNYDADVTITPTVNGSSTAESGDYTIDLTPLTFDANETLTIPLTIKDDADSDDETIIIDFTVTSGTANLGTSQHTVTITDNEAPPAPSIIISEVTDPADVFQGRYVEIYNNGNSAIDLSSQQVHIVFQANGGTLSSRALSGTLNANEVMIIGNSSNINTNYGFNADENFGTINGNGDDGLFLYFGGDESSGTLFDSYGVLNTDGTGEAWEYENSRAIRNNPTSVSPNATWTASEWTISSADIADCTPGALESEFRFDGDWKPRNISNATTSDNVLITSSVAISSNLSINNFEVDNAATVTINSGIALIVNGTSSGNITYQRTLATTNWYLMGAPVSSEAYDATWVEDNGIDDTSSSNNNVGIGSYNTTNNNWSYVSSSPSVGSGNFNTGTGYIIKQDVAGTVSFTGTVNTGDQNINLSTSGQRFNAMGNPFSSFLATANFLNNEDAIGDTQNIWVWNQSLGTSGAYEVKDASAAFVLAPGQGFFVRSDSSGDSNFVFPSADRSLTGNAFQKTNQNLVSIQLWLNNSGTKNYCTIRYMDSANKGFDVGKDGEIFGGVSTKFGIYSQLVSNNNGKKYQLQSLPDIDFEEMIIPIGIISEANQSLSISANITNLPKGLTVYLEDRLEGTFTSLDNGEVFTVTTLEALNGTGRFYLHTTSQVLNTQNLINDSVSIFLDAKKLYINGLDNSKNEVTIYNLLGKQVNAKLFTTAGNKTIDLNHLSNGVYIVKLENNAGFVSKKIIIE